MWCLFNVVFDWFVLRARLVGAHVTVGGLSVAAGRALLQGTESKANQSKAKIELSEDGVGGFVRALSLSVSLFSFSRGGGGGS
jgi:hypothetical protein